MRVPHNVGIVGDMKEPMPHRQFRCNPDQWAEANRIARILGHNLSAILRDRLSEYIARNHELASRYAKIRKDGPK